MCVPKWECVNVCESAGIKSVSSFIYFNLFT